MINIPTPEKWMKIYPKIYDDNGNIPVEELESILNKGCVQTYEGLQ